MMSSVTCLKHFFLYQPLLKKNISSLSSKNVFTIFEIPLALICNRLHNNYYFKVNCFLHANLTSHHLHQLSLSNDPKRRRQKASSFLQGKHRRPDTNSDPFLIFARWPSSIHIPSLMTLSHFLFTQIHLSF